MGIVWRKYDDTLGLWGWEMGSGLGLGLGMVPGLRYSRSLTRLLTLLH